MHGASADTLTTIDEWFLINGTSDIEAAGNVESYGPGPGCDAACYYGWSDTVTISVFDRANDLVGSATVNQFISQNEYSESHSFPIDGLAPPQDAVTAEIAVTFAVNGVGSGFYVYTCCDMTPIPGPPSETPLPGALPLFATDVSAIGLLGWRRKRKVSGIVDAA